MKLTYVLFVYFFLDSQTEDNVIVRWRNGDGVIVPDYLEIPQYDISKVIVKDRKGVYNIGLFN